ncbi:PhoX family protein [Acinetobacter guillouiae]|uniref:PhoX family protein n=1 Tax=Acinetobacter guillouiae TaxID=106649 RepID=A0A8X8GM98_ACIGI|nr:alkaline phosphatase PhoX [Acinetobacter guillouiae]MCF0266482.1 PhoX family protein [Acinetobacter guillouiae]
MTNSASRHTRREVLTWLASIPFLPLGAMATSATLAGCNDDDKNTAVKPPINPAKLKSATFIPMDAPTVVAAMATTTCTSKLSINWDDGSSTTYQLGYKPFFLTGTEVPDGKGGKVIAGGYYDIKNQPIIDRSVAGKERQFFSDCPDGSSLISFKQATGKDFTDADKKALGVTGNPVFHVVQFEYLTKDQAGGDTYGKLSSPIAVLTLDQDPKTGHLTLIKYHNVDTSSAHGLWITCGASLSPWGTHLSSEEYEPDAFNQGLGQSAATLKAFSKNIYGDETSANPYNYGHLPEITVKADGTGSVKKHYCLGRISHELVQVFADNRTVLMGDDYTNGGLFMFVADKEKDLSAGTLYVAKYTTQLTDTTSGKISWIKLGHATSAEIENLIKSGIKSTDIFDSKLQIVKYPTDATADEKQAIDASKPTADQKLLADAANARLKMQQTNQKAELEAQGFKFTYLSKIGVYLKLKDNSDKTKLAAAFLETHRYAAYVGASMALTKNEGTTVNTTDKKAYSALANIVDSMVEGGSGYLAEHNVKFPKITAGGILEHKLAGGQIDSTNVAINSEWVPSESSVLLKGKDISFDSFGNTADPSQIASPDNLKFSEKLRVLFIGEDSGNHLNNYLWAYNVDTKKLDRVLSAPAGAESTGLHAVDEVNGWTYIMSNFQHPGDEWNRFYKETDGVRSGLSKDMLAQLDAAINTNYNNKFAAAVGYITADPIAPSVEKKSS